VEKEDRDLTRSYRFDQPVVQLAGTSIRPCGVHKMAYFAAFLRVFRAVAGHHVAIHDELPWFYAIRRRSGDRSLAA
jgi:hypothetical protein